MYEVLNKYQHAPANAKPNVLIKADSYKGSHFKQYPEGTEFIYSYIAPRKGSNPVVILGIHDFCEMIDDVVYSWNIQEFMEISEAHGIPFNEGWWDLLKKYHAKPLPLRVMGVPEGTVVDPGTPAACIVNTDPEFPWLTSFFETLFLRTVWYPSSVASNSRAIKVRLKEFMEITGANLDTLPFKLHDFGARGATSCDAAAAGGHGHLTQFLGTDTLEALKYVRDRYGSTLMPGFSIPATEHSTVTSWGRENEKEMYETFIKKNGGKGKIFACVSDSYNIWESLKMWKELEPLLLETGGTLVVRPDSGDPIQTPVSVIEKLLQLFGHTVNEKGFKVLPDHIRVIQGDGINTESLVRICQLLVDKKISIDNIAFGMGGGLLQKVDRDTYGFAMKCSAARVNGEWRDVYKDPIAGGKTSIKGIVGRNLERVEHPDNVVFGDEIPFGFIEYYNENGAIERPEWDKVKQRCNVET